MRRLPVIVCALIVATLGHQNDALAEPTWQLPWPNAKSPSADPKWEVSGYSYNCGPTHDNNTGGPVSDPSKWDLKAIDFGLDSGSSVAATADGIVVDRHEQSNAFGHYLVVDHVGYYSMYAHLSAFSISLGARVRAGEKIADSGNTGVGPGNYHLHFQAGKGTSSSIFAREPEDMTGIDSSNGIYDGWDNFGQWGVCGGASPYWFSGPHLSDAVLLNPSTGDGDFHFSKSDGTFATLEDADSSTFPATITAGFFGTVGSIVGDEVSDLLFYNANAIATNRWETWIRRPNTNPPSWNVTDGDTPGEKVFMSGAKVYPAELNGDGLTDIILYDDDIGTTAKYETWIANPNDPGSWTEGASVPTWVEGWKLVTGYFNADNLTDVLTYNPNGTGWRIRRANSSGDGGFTTMDFDNFPNCCQEILVGYFDDDRISDTYRYEPNGTFWAVRFGNGAGHWRADWGNGSWGGAVDTHLIGYFNEGKKNDLLRYDSGNGSYSTKIANGTGGWSDQVNGSFFANRSLYLAQLDQDERTDLILYANSTGNIGTRFSQNVGEWSFDQCGNCTWDTNQTLAVAYLDRDSNAT